MNPLWLCCGVVIQTDVESYTGRYLYSDFAYDPTMQETHTTLLNNVTRIPVIGIAGGIARLGLAVFHTFDHTISYFWTSRTRPGHLIHAAKGACEGICGIFEAIPVAGRIFTNVFRRTSCSCRPKPRSWWMIKIYNPNHPDLIDRIENNWVNLQGQLMFV